LPTSGTFTTHAAGDELQEANMPTSPPSPIIHIIRFEELNWLATDPQPRNQNHGHCLHKAVKPGKFTTSLVFQVDSVEKTGTPGGAQGHDWYRYVLKNHRSTISGLRRGSHQHVCAYAADYAERLNTRILFGSSNWQSRRTKAARHP